MPKILPPKYRNLKSESYERYLTKELESLNSNFIVKTYKTAGDAEKWSSFQKGEDLRIQIRWKKDVIDEFIVDKSFWLTSNRDRDDQKYMRDFAHIHLDPIKKAYSHPKKKGKDK